VPTIAICADQETRDHLGGSVDDDVVIAGSPGEISGADNAIVMVADGGESALAEAMAADPRVTAVIARSAGARAIGELVRHLQSGTGIDDLVPEGTPVRARRVASYDDKLRCLEELDRFAAEHKLRGKHREAMALCVDELLMNALYSAPREAAGDVDADARTIAARARQGVLVRWAMAGKRVYVSALDGYGSLDRKSLVRAWRRAAPGDNASSAPGLGIHLIAGSSSAIWFRRAPGVATECVCAFDLDAPRVAMERVAVIEESDPDRISALEREIAEASVPVPRVVDMIAPQPRRALAQAAIATAVLAPPVAIAVAWAAAGVVPALVAGAAGALLAAILIKSNVRAASSIRVDDRGIHVSSPLGLGRAIAWDELVSVDIEPARDGGTARLRLRGRAGGVRSVSIELVGSDEQFAAGARRLVDNARGRAELLDAEVQTELADFRRSLPLAV
jgi:hypothetical protein